MSNFISIQNLFCNKKLRFCSKRDYRWRRKVVEALLLDINRALETGVSHYLGTIVLSKAEDVVYEVIDGQQRLMTIILVICVFLTQSIHAQLEIESKVLDNLTADLGRNTDFVSALLSNQQVEAFTRGEECLVEVYSCINNKAKEVFAMGGDVFITRWLNCLLLFEIIPDITDRYPTEASIPTEYKL